jgi:hypothetical protein
LASLAPEEKWAIAFGSKRVENRTWSTPYRGLLAVHAGAGIDWDAPEEAWAAAGLVPYDGGPRGPWRAGLALGAVIAVADLAGCHDHRSPALARGGTRKCSPWAVSGAWHWELEDVRPLREPVPCRGMLGLWRPPEDEDRAVRGQLGLAAPHG